VNAQISDCWEGLQLGDLKIEEEGRPPSASIHILADFTWDNLQLAIHRSTTKSMFNIIQKLHEFIMQQKRRSERTISIMLPAGSAASKALAAYREEQKRAEEEKKETVATRNHRLWAIRVGSVDLMRTLGIHTPDDQLHDVCLGGKITIAGQNVCLVCFHGTSFRETEWAVFNIDLINASFSTQAIPGLGAAYMMESQAEEGFAGPTHRKRIHTCQQICTLQLGTDNSRSAELATVWYQTKYENDILYPVFAMLCEQHLLGRTARHFPGACKCMDFVNLNELEAFGGWLTCTQSSRASNVLSILREILFSHSIQWLATGCVNCCYLTM